MGRIKIIKASPICSIQDRGRFGYRKWGIPQSGFMDSLSANRANQLVENDLNAPLIEYAGGVLEIEALDEVNLGIVGGNREMTIPLKKGENLYINLPKRVYGYLSIKGEIVANENFNSKSTYPPARFGGINGTYLKKGDIIEVKPTNSVQSAPIDLSVNESNQIRIMKGPEWTFLKEGILKRSFEVSSEINRMAIKLKGKLEIDQKEITSSAVITGTIQVPPNGEPIILMNDCQTTGGYPRIAKVLDEDLGKLAQMRSGTMVEFQVVE